MVRSDVFLILTSNETAEPALIVPDLIDMVNEYGSSVVLAPGAVCEACPGRANSIASNIMGCILIPSLAKRAGGRSIARLAPFLLISFVCPLKGINVELLHFEKCLGYPRDPPNDFSEYY